MIDPQQSSSAADETRLELALAASTSERANKPKWIIVLGIALLAITIIFSLVSLKSRSTVRSKLDLDRAATRKVTDLKAQFDIENAKLTARGTAANPRIGQNIESLAQGMGVLLAGPINDSQQVALSQVGMQQHKYTAKAVNQDPLTVLKWLDAVQTNPQTSGMEITRLVLRPANAATNTGSAAWNIDVDFSRWEKIK